MAAASRVASKQLKTQEEMVQQIAALTAMVEALAQKIEALEAALKPKAQEKTNR